MSPRFKHFRARGIKFVFKYDDAAQDLLHIYVRHLTTPQDAVNTFFSARATWNEEFNRFETFSASHGLFWFWLEEEKTVMIISCFRI